MSLAPALVSGCSRLRWLSMLLASLFFLSPFVLVVGRFLSPVPVILVTGTVGFLSPAPRLIVGSGWSLRLSGPFVSCMFLTEAIIMKSCDYFMWEA